MGLTKRQKQISEQRHNNVLVSAAAGSGKTTVLVERILEKVLDKNNPVDIDSFLVVTYTKAAAASMRDKIISRLEDYLEKEPENEHIMKQLLLVNRADITTIDSFCLKLVKEHFSLLDLDSSFGIGDESMMELMRNDVLDELFEEKYQDKNFKKLVDIFAKDKQKDDGLKAAVLEVYRKADSYTQPRVWLQNAKEALNVNSLADMESTKWYPEAMVVIRGLISEIDLKIEQARNICMMAGGPANRIVTVEADKETIKPLLEAKTYMEFQTAFNNISWAKAALCRGNSCDPDIKKQFDDLRTSYKNRLKRLHMFKSDEATLVKEFEALRDYLIPLIELTEEFMVRFEQVEKERKVVTFSDVEHMAFRLVCDGYDTNGCVITSEVGKTISERYEEIYIDEYQDSNFLQEDILSAISKFHKGIYNMFMVGDVKQSIYRFRLARPDLFVAKYERFVDINKETQEDHEENEVVIELKENFRSRAVVLEPVNFFFYQLMGADFGGIDYNKDVALVPARLFAEPEEAIADNISKNMEIMIAEDKDQAQEDVTEQVEENGDSLEEDDLEQQNYRRYELEAHMVGQKIRDMMYGEHPLYVFDDDAECYRLVQYRDIVILGRSMKDFGNIMYEVLAGYGIPVYLEDPKGYFEAVEIKVVMSMLSVVDNARQDIPLTAVLLSPIGKMTEEDLAIVCQFAYQENHGKDFMYEKCQWFATVHEDSQIARKLNDFFAIVEDLKKSKKQLSISQLIWKMLDDTGYYLYASAMPAGEKRRANLDMLMEKAKVFERGYYKGLFHFLRYIEKIKVNEVDFGEASLVGDDEDVVRIMTMHKSKGLEYPVVFVSGLGKGFNKQDSNSNLVIHPDYYLSANQMNNKKRYMRRTFVRECFRRLINADNMAEELRVLYVAMTRAKEKMILTGCSKDVDRVMEQYAVLRQMHDTLLPYAVRHGASNFLDLIIACMVRVEGLSKKKGIAWNEMMETTICRKKDIEKNIVLDASKQMDSYNQLFREALELPLEQFEEDEIYKEYKDSFESEYEYQPFTKIRSKMSISDIKKMKAYDGQGYDVETEFVSIQNHESQNHENQNRENQNIESQKLTEFDDSMEKQDNSEKTDKRKNSSSLKLTGAERGTIVHKFMELLPFENFDEMDSNKDVTFKLQQYLKDFMEKGIFDKREADAISMKKIVAMIKSSLGIRMCKAAKENQLYKEKQFSIGVPAHEIYEYLPETEDVVIVQGIIDAYFYENDKIVVMDYKTDYADEETLIGRYKAQLDSYADTLAKLLNKEKVEKIIYSFSLNKVLPLE